MPIGSFRLNTLSAAMADTTLVATGGTIGYVLVSNALYKTHTFTTTGSTNFVVTGSTTADVLIVGGGGAGGGVTTTYGMGGGGGAGQLIYNTGVSISNQTYTISVGAGGTGVSGAPGNAGTASSALGYTASGGGAGTTNTAATNGGGSGTNSSTSFTSTAGTFPYKGGNSFGSATTTSRGAGGGAGAGGVGSNATSATGGQGGPGISNNIDGLNLYYAAGGGGSGPTTAGANGAGNSGTDTGSGRNGTSAGNNATVATAGYGYGGGGANNEATTASAGGNGSQGIVIIRYPVPQVTTLSYLTSTTSTTSSITIPATSQVGDLALLFEFSRNTGASPVTVVTPSGWTLFTQATAFAVSPGATVTAFYKILVSGDPGTSITAMSGTSGNNKIMAIYRGNIPVSYYQAAVNTWNTSTNGTISSTTVPMTGLVGPFVGFGLYAATSSTGTRSSTQTATRELSSGTFLFVKLFDSTSNSVSFTTSTISETANTGNNFLGGGSIAIQ